MQGLVSYFADKNKCDTFVRGSGSAKFHSSGWQFLTFPIGVASSKCHINTRLLTLLESCLAAIWQPGFLQIAPHINLRKLNPFWLVILTNELHSTKQWAYYVHDDDKAWYENQKESSVQSLWRHASCQFLIIPPQHLWLSGFLSPPEGLPFSHTTRDGIKDPLPQSFRRFIGLRCVSCNICRTCGLLESFSAKKQCVKNFRLHEKKWWWLSPPSHTKLRLWPTVNSS